MPIPLLRTLDPDVGFVAGGQSNFRLPKGMAHRSAVLYVTGTINLSAGTVLTARPRGVPIRLIQLVSDQGITPHNYRGRDAVVEAELYEQTPLATIYTPPAGTSTATNYTFAAQIPLFFSEPRSNESAWLYTGLPSWAYTGDVLLRVFWGDATELYSSGGVAPVGAFSNVTVKLVLDSADKVAAEVARAGGNAKFTDRFWQTFKTITEINLTNGTAFALDLPRTEDTRSLIIMTENTTGDFSNGIVNAWSLEENNSVQRVANVPSSVLQANAARIFGATPAAGVHVLEFADDNDLTNILPSSSYDQLQLKGTPSANGVLRVLSRRLGSPKR